MVVERMDVERIVVERMVVERMVVERMVVERVCYILFLILIRIKTFFDCLCQ